MDIVSISLGIKFSLEEADEEGRPIEMPPSRDQDRRPLAARAVGKGTEQQASEVCLYTSRAALLMATFP